MAILMRCRPRVSWFVIRGGSIDVAQTQPENLPGATGRQALQPNHRLDHRVHEGQAGVHDESS